MRVVKTRTEETMANETAEGIGDRRAAIAVRPTVAAPRGDLRSRAGMPGEMALQSLFGHHATQSVQQGLVRLVGYRDPTYRGVAVRDPAPARVKPA
jgi:hypothetical protein